MTEQVMGLVYEMRLESLLSVQYLVEAPGCKGSREHLNYREKHA